ncbi:MAG: alanine racemase, partial [Mycobacterium sp.]
SEPRPGAMAEALASAIRPTLYTLEGVRAANEAASVRAGAQPCPVHVKVDTGMHRVGASPDVAIEIARTVARSPGLHLEGLWTHMAVAEEVDDPFSARQLEQFGDVVRRLSEEGISADITHAGNSAGAIAHPASRMDMVRCGIAIYGYAPSPGTASILADGSDDRLRPAMSLSAHVCHVQELDAGERVSYGRRYAVSDKTVVATVPIGYADGLPRRLFDAGGEVLIKGRRLPIAGAVTMDLIMVDCGPEASVAVGDEVVLLGRQGANEIWADDWARWLDTISYEIVCGIGRRVPRVVSS